MYICFEYHCNFSGLSQGDENFTRCPSEALVWDHRKLHIIEELLQYNNTIICLQEVDRFPFIDNELSKAGYQGVFFPKPDSPCLYTSVQPRSDGCAVFWKTSEMCLQQQTDIVLEDKNGDKTNQVAILCRFSMTAVCKELFVAVTHLKSKSAFLHLRQEQGAFFEHFLLSYCSQSPVVLCGDFNAQPDEAVYSIFKESKLEIASAYTCLSNDFQEPSYTTWKIRGDCQGSCGEIAQCIDYVWCSKRHFYPISLLRLPADNEIGESRLPSLNYPSDHISLVVDLFIYN